MWEVHSQGKQGGRGISVSAASVSPGVGIWKSCRVVLCALSGICLVEFTDSFRVAWAATMGDFGILVGRGLGMV